MSDLKGVRRMEKDVKSISVDELNSEILGNMQFSITRTGRFRCQICEDDIGFITFKTLSTFGRHYQRYHLK